MVAKGKSESKMPVLTEDTEPILPWRTEKLTHERIPHMKADEEVKNCVAVNCYARRDVVPGHKFNEQSPRATIFALIHFAGVWTHKLLEFKMMQLKAIVRIYIKNGIAHQEDEAAQNEESGNEAINPWLWLRDGGNIEYVKQMYTPVQKEYEAAKKRKEGKHSSSYPSCDDDFYAGGDASNDTDILLSGLGSKTMTMNDVDWAQDVISTYEIAQCRVEVDYEILWKKDKLAQTHSCSDPILPRGVSGVRVWVWLVGPNSLTGGISLDEGLDRGMAANRARVAKTNKEDSGPKRQNIGKVKRKQHTIDFYTSVYTHLLRNVYQHYVGARCGLTKLWLSAHTRSLFKGADGNVNHKISLLDENLVNYMKPNKLWITHIMDPQIAITRECVRGADYHFMEQRNVDCYFAGHFEDSYIQTKYELLQAEAEKLAPLYDKMNTKRDELEWSQLTLEELEHEDMLLQTKILDDDSDTYTDDTMRRRLVRTSMDRCSTDIELKNEEMQAIKLEIKEIRTPLSEFLQEKLRDPTAPVWRNGIKFNMMPQQVKKHAWYRVGMENFRHPSDVYNHSFFGYYYEQQLREIKKSVVMDDPIDVDNGMLLPSIYHPDAGDCEKDHVDGMDRTDYTGEDTFTPLDSTHFEEDQGKEQIQQYLGSCNNKHTSLHEFQDDHADEFSIWKDSWASARDGKSNSKRFQGFYVQQRKMMKAYTDVYAQSPEYCTKAQAVVQHCMSPSTGFFYTNLDDAKYYVVDERLDATSELGDEVMQMIMCQFHVAFETAYLHRAGMVLLLCVVDASNPRKVMRVHFLGYGQRGNGKSRVGQVVEMICIPEFVGVVTKETKSAPFTNDKSSSHVCGSKMWHEAPGAAFRTWTKGSEAGDDEVEQLKTEMSEMHFKIMTAYCVQAADGNMMRGRTELSMLAQQQLTWFSNTLNPIKDIRPALLDRLLYWCALTMTPEERTAAAINSTKTNDEKIIGKHDPLHVYTSSVSNFVHRWQMLVHFHGVMAYYAPGTFTPNANAHAVVFDAVNRVLKKRGHPEIGNRQSERAKRLAEQIMWARLTYRLFHTPYARWGPKATGFSFDDMWDQNRTLESRLVISFSDSYKAFSSIMHMDRNDEVNNVLQAIGRLIVEREDFTFSSMFGDRIEKQACGRRRDGTSMNNDIGTSSAVIDLDYVKFAVSKSDINYMRFCSDVSGKTRGIKLSTLQVQEIIEFMSTSDTWNRVTHHEYDVNFQDDDAITTTLSDALMCDEEERGPHPLVTNNNLDRVGKKWRQEFGCPMTDNMRGRYYFPWENPAALGPNDQPASMRTTNTFVFEIKEKGYIGVSLHLILLAMRKEGGLNTKLENELLNELRDSHMTSRFYGSPGSGMAGINLDAPQVLDGAYVTNSTEKSSMFINHRHVSDRLHGFLGGGQTNKADECNQVAMCLQANKPITTQATIEQIENIMTVDPIYPTVYHLFSSDVEGIQLVAEGLLIKAFEIPRCRQYINGISDSFDPTNPDVVDSTESKEYNPPHSSDDLKRALEELLEIPPNEGGYMDLVYHCNPWATESHVIKGICKRDQFQRSKDELVFEVLCCYYSKGEGTLYTKSLNLGGKSIWQKDLSKLNKQIDTLQEISDDLQNDIVVDNGPKTKEAMLIELKTLQDEIDDKKKQSENTSIWMQKRVNKEKSVLRTVMRDRGIQFAHKSFLHERASRGDRQGAHSSLGYIEWLRAESKRLFVKRQLIHQQIITTGSNQIVIPEKDLKRYAPIS
jgi:hypothetical protein